MTTDTGPRRRLDADAILDGLDPEQREAARAVQGPVCVLAGAGTGKTRAITHRIAFGVHSQVYVPQRVLAVTFTARAAGEMRVRLRDLGVQGVQARTFHAAALRQLGYFWPKVMRAPLPGLVEHKAGLVAEAAARLHLQVDRPVVRDLAAEIEWSKVAMLASDQYPAAALAAGHTSPGGMDVTTVARMIDAYEDVKTERGVIDFEDVLLLALGVLEEYPEVLAQVREQYRHFVVDEYQDVNLLQQRLLETWVGERADLCVVGDPRQTIYTFTGATARHLLEFPQRHPGCTVVRLVRNYRSTPQVVQLANDLARDAGPGLDLVAQRAAGPEPRLRTHDDDLAEAAATADAVARLVADGRPAGQIAVLFRTNAQSEPLEQALAERDVPYLVRGGERFFARKEVRDAVLVLRGAVRSSQRGAGLADEVRAVLASVGYTASPPAGGGAVRERWESMHALVGLAEDLAASTPGAGLAEFVAELGERAAHLHAPSVDGVTLASLHAAKGLEWDCVFVVGVGEGLLPISLAQTPEAVEEEKRLLYVGVTRAREVLELSWARARTPGGRATRQPSRFLAGLLQGRSQRTRGTAPADAAGTVVARERAGKPVTCRVCGRTLTAGAERKIGRCLGCPSSYDEALLERLHGWRSAMAAEMKVPPFVVLTDATLIAVAEQLPDDTMALVRVPGVGPAKGARYGPDLLRVLHDPADGAAAPGTPDLPAQRPAT